MTCAPYILQIYLDALQERMHASNTDMWEAYWTEEGPRGEEFCRNRLVEQLAGLMPDAIRLEPEMRMPERRRADIVAIYSAVGSAGRDQGPMAPRGVERCLRPARRLLCSRMARAGSWGLHRSVVRRRTWKAAIATPGAMRTTADLSSAPSDADRPSSRGATFAD